MTTVTMTFHVRQTFSDGVWLTEIVEIPEVHSFGRTLGKAREYVVDALALWLDEPIETVRESIVFESPDLPDPIREAAQLAVGAREIADCINKEATELMAAGASALVRDGHLSIRDAAEVLGISHQRVHQILGNADQAIAAAAEMQSRQVDFKEIFDQWVTEGGAKPLPWTKVDGGDVLTAIGLLLVGGAIGALIAKS